MYTNVGQFHADINKIWMNSYTFNDKGTLIHKLTTDMDKYHKALMSGEGLKKGIKGEKMKQKQEKILEKQQEKMEKEKPVK